MTTEADRMTPLETGGLLFGYWSSDGRQAVIAEVTGPGPSARHSKTEFIPDDNYQDRMIDEIYARSGRRNQYLGDWHTHPCGEDALSYKDRRTLQRIAKSAEIGLSAPLMAVLASKHEWRLCFWHYVPPRTLHDRLTLQCARACTISQC
jgi:integrative and conjugative element protein (TIGR02256 family)